MTRDDDKNCKNSKEAVCSFFSFHFLLPRIRIKVTHRYRWISRSKTHTYTHRKIQTLAHGYIIIFSANGFNCDLRSRLIVLLYRNVARYDGILYKFCSAIASEGDFFFYFSRRRGGTIYISDVFIHEDEVEAGS